MAFSITEWYNNKAAEVIYSFKGSVTSDIIPEALELVENHLVVNNENKKIRKKVYNVFIECLQNLYHHVDKAPKDIDKMQTENFGVIILSREDNFYKITTGNFIDRDKISAINDRIVEVNSLSDKEIRERYLAVMGNNTFSEKGGGGLGLLDIARKTGNKLEYYFYKYSEEHIFFSLDVYIS